MKKGLRRSTHPRSSAIRPAVTPCPDEEGIKTYNNRNIFWAGNTVTPCPDEEGIKTAVVAHIAVLRGAVTPCPDEEGIKTRQMAPLTDGKPPCNTLP